MLNNGTKRIYLLSVFCQRNIFYVLNFVVSLLHAPVIFAKLLQSNMILLFENSKRILSGKLLAHFVIISWKLQLKRDFSNSFFQSKTDGFLFFPLVCAGNRSQQQLALTERVIILLIEKSD